MRAAQKRRLEVVRRNNNRMDESALFYKDAFQIRIADWSGRGEGRGMVLTDSRDFCLDRQSAR